MKYLVTPSDVQFVDDEIPLYDAVQTCEKISKQIEEIGNGPKRNGDTETRVDNPPAA